MSGFWDNWRSSEGIVHGSGSGEGGRAGAGSLVSDRGFDRGKTECQVTGGVSECGPENRHGCRLLFRWSPSTTMCDPPPGFLSSTFPGRASHPYRPRRCQLHGHHSRTARSTPGMTSTKGYPWRTPSKLLEANQGASVGKIICQSSPSVTLEPRYGRGRPLRKPPQAPPTPHRTNLSPYTGGRHESLTWHEELSPICKEIEV